VAKDKKKKKDKKSGKSEGVAAKASKTLHALSQNRMVADVVAAALVATASGLKDSDKARRMAASVSDELEGLAKDSARRGNAMWKLALDIGRKALDEIGSDQKPTKKPTRPAKAKTVAKKVAKTVKAKPAKSAKPVRPARKAKA
jgi:hypothetical protein